MKTHAVTPIPVVRALRSWGTTSAMPGVGGVSRCDPGAACVHQPHDLDKVEKGNPGVSLGTYATVLFVLGMIERLADLADPKNDALGLQLEEENLPVRIRLSHKQKPRPDDRGTE